MSGIISVTGDEDAPAKSGVPLSDLCAGLFAAYGILCALEYRERTGLGQLVDTSLLEAAMALTVWESTEYWVTGQAPKPLGSAHRLTAPYQAVRAADGYFNVGANNDKLFEGLCRAIGRPDLRDDARFATSALGWSIAPRSSRPSRRPPPASRAPTGSARLEQRGRPVGSDQHLCGGAGRSARAGAADGGRPRASGRGADQGARHPRQALGHARRRRSCRAAARPAHRRHPDRARLHATPSSAPSATGASI